MPHITTELLVNPVPLTVNVVAVPGALAENGESLLISNAGVFSVGPKLMSQTPRPCMAARNVREGLCRFRDRICELGRVFAAPRGDQVAALSFVKNAPTSVPT